MKDTIRSSIAAAALAATALPLSLAPASAMPTAQPLPLADSAPPVILTSGGCGPYRHRGPFGGCRPNFVGYGYGYGWHRPWGWGGWHRPWGWGGWHRHWGWRRW